MDIVSFEITNTNKESQLSRERSSQIESFSCKTFRSGNQSFLALVGDTVRKIKLLLRQKGDAFDSSVKSFLNTESLSAITILRPDWNKFQLKRQFFTPFSNRTRGPVPGIDVLRVLGGGEGHKDVVHFSRVIQPC